MTSKQPGASASTPATASTRKRDWAAFSPRRRAIIACFWVLAVFNVALPKGGFKVSDVPVTFGYIFLALFACLAIVALIRRPLSMSMPALQFGAFFLPISLIIMTKFEAYGMPAALTLIYLTTFLFLPIIVLVILSPFLEEIPADAMGRAIVLCVRFSVAWGVANFIIFPIAHNLIQIPYITVNAADYGEIMNKNNMRGALMKLVSTYNNGNLYGVCMVMLGPIYLLFERSRFWGGLLFFALICTLSRTVWFATAAMAAMMVVTGQIQVRRSGLWLGAAGLVMIVALLLPLMGWSSDQLANASLGTRARSFTTFELTVFGRSIVNIPELVYFGFLNSFGIAGFPLALGCLAMGPLYALMHYPSLSPLRRAAFAGTCTYMAAALIDGAFVFPPTIVQFLFLTGLIYRRGLRPDDQPGRVGPFVARGEVG